MKLKKVISMFLATAMVVGMLAGCGNTTTGTQTPTPAGSQQGSEKTPEPTKAPVKEVKAAAIESKNISASAQSLITTAETEFGGKLYLKALTAAYGRMVSGDYSTGTPVVAKVGDKNKAVTLNMSVLYNKLRMSYTLDKAYEAADGNTYKMGDLLPTWKQIQEDIGFTINDVTSTATSVGNNYKEAKTGNFITDKGAIDVICVSAQNANEDGQTGAFVQLDQYFDYMPDFKAFLDNNQVVKDTITAGDGHIYFAPYFDGYNDIEKAVLLRVDWVKALLNGDFDASKFDGAYTGNMSYTAYMPASATGEDAIEVKVVSADGKKAETIKKEYKKNITAVLAELPDKSGATLVKALRDYIDTTYNGYYGSNRADLFVGQNAAYDADEFVALVRCVVANPKYLTNGKNDIVYGLFGREATLQRCPDLITLCCNLFGVRGADAEKDYLYFDAEGNLKDGRQSSEMYYVIEKMNQLYNDGLILKDFDKEGAGGASGTKIYDTMYKSNLGFGLYDYVQTQTAYNLTVSQELKDMGFDLEPVINPVAYWYTTSNTIGTWTRFTESWRSVKTEGWSITTLCENDPDKLANALELFNYMYTTEGNRVMSYGPDAWIEHDAKGNIVYIDYQGQQVPKLSAAALNELATLEANNYTNYYRNRLGATFPIGYIKQQGMEYQCTAPQGKAGLEKINNALVLGVIEHVQVNTADCATPFYRIIPTTFATTSNENQIISQQTTNLSEYYSKEKGKYNIFIEAIKNGFEKALADKASAK